MTARRLRTGRPAIAGLAMLALLAGPAQAVQPDEIVSDPVIETRARALSAGLRCLVCQNQSIDDSDAPLARDLRILVRERLKAGDSDGEVRDFLVARYGEFVLLRPPFGWHTLLLWLTPLLAIGAGAAWLWHRRGRVRAVAAPLSEDESAAVAAILEKGPKQG